MAATDYLRTLNDRLGDGALRLPAEFRRRHARYLAGLQRPDGGFAGREGESDLYYTGFALRGLAVLDELSPDAAGRAAGFLKASLTRPASVVDFYSLLYACLLVQASGGPEVLAGSPAGWPDRVAAALEAFRTADGGYAKAAGAASASTYHTFLVGLCYQMLGRQFPRPEEVGRFVASRRREDGGYVEIGPMKRGGTNPTAAAVGTLQMVQGDDFRPADHAPTAAFLADMVSLEGGLKANARAPLGDLLSTFTGCWTLSQLDALDRIDAAGALAYARSLEQPGGGFRGGLWDEACDVEYTFYGLATLALLTP